MEVENVILVVILCFLILYTITHLKPIIPPPPDPIPPYPIPYPYPVGGCAGTRYGCCPDNTTAKQDAYGGNCYYHPPLPPNPYPPNPYPPNPYPVGGCGGTIYGCCPDKVTAKHDAYGSNCPSYPQPYPVGGCGGTRYGCCPDNMTAKHDDIGSNCSSYPPPPPPPPPPPNPNNNTCPTSQQGGNCTDNEYSCEQLFGGKLYPNYSGCSKGSSCCITQPK